MRQTVMVQKNGREVWEWEKAVGVLGAMEKAGVAPNLYSYNGALIAFEQGGEWEKTLDLFDRMRSLGSTPDAGSYSTALVACIGTFVF